MLGVKIRGSHSITYGNINNLSSFNHHQRGDFSAIFLPLHLVQTLLSLGSALDGGASLELIMNILISYCRVLFVLN